MSKIIVNAPIQNTEFSPDQKIGKVVSLFVADYVRAHDDSYDDKGYDLWNNVLVSQQYGFKPAEYKRYTDGLLAEKYASDVLSRGRLYANSSTILQDTDADQFQEFARNVIVRSAESGAIKISEQQVRRCGNCSTLLSLESSPYERACPSCHSPKQVIDNQSVATGRIDKVVEQQVGRAVNQSEIYQYREQQVLLSRHRLGGISLEAIGLREQVLDPRASLGLLALYAAHVADAHTVEVVASRATMAHNLPQFFSVIKSQVNELPELKMKPIVKLPVQQLQYLEGEGYLPKNVLFDTLSRRVPPELLRMKHDMTPQSLDRLVFKRKQ